MSKSYIKISLFALSFLTISALQAQIVNKDVSPFSRLGLGDFVYQNTATTLGMGGFSAAFSTAFHANFQNPASLGYLRSTTFEAGLFGEFSKLKFNNEEASVRNGNLSYLSLGFPLANSLNQVLDRKQKKLRWGMNFSLLPYTTVGYAIETTDVHPDLDTIVNNFSGSGGTNKLVWGNGVQFGNFSAGVNLGFLFGNIEFTRQAQFMNIANSYRDVFKDKFSVNGFIWDVGAMYKIDFGKNADENDGVLSDHTITFGIFGHPSTSFSTENTNLRSRVSELFSSVVDTISVDFNENGSGTLPAEWTVGVMYRYKTKLNVGLDVSFADWSNYENDAKPEQLHESFRIAGGLQYTPDAISYNSYFKRISYRFGGYYVDDPRGLDLKQYALTIGFGLPIVLPRQQTSFINFAFEFGQYNSDTIDENFVKINVGFTLNDNSWFFKRKFN